MARMVVTGNPVAARSHHCRLDPFWFVAVSYGIEKQTTDAYRRYKMLLGRSLLLALEFMVAADVIRTVLLDLTAQGLEILGGLVAIRTFLSWSVTVELDGHWPWQSAALAARTERVGGDNAS